MSMLANGAYDRHLRRARRKYRATRDALVAAVNRHAPHLGVHGIAAGLHALITLPQASTNAPSLKPPGSAA